MTKTKNTLLSDIGGTHARFACYESQGTYINFRKYRLNDFTSFPDIIDAYMNDVQIDFTNARFSVARPSVNGVIDYKRDAGDPDYVIDFNICEEKYGWKSAAYLNDLKAGAHGLKAIKEDGYTTILNTNGNRWNTYKLLISVGTGVGHAGIMDDKIMRTCGGHFLPITVTKEQRAVEAFIRKSKDPNFDLIMEDFVSGRGLRSITAYVSGQSNDTFSPSEFLEHLKHHPDAVRLFFEFLGLYAHNVTCVTGFYGGVFLTGGVIDHLITAKLADWKAFEQFFRPKMVSVMNDRLHSTSVSYVTHTELPLLGLTIS